MLWWWISTKRRVCYSVVELCLCSSYPLSCLTWQIAVILGLVDFKLDCVCVCVCVCVCMYVCASLSLGCLIILPDSNQSLDIWRYDLQKQTYTVIAQMDEKLARIGYACAYVNVSPLESLAALSSPLHSPTHTHMQIQPTTTTKSTTKKRDKNEE